MCYSLKKNKSYLTFEEVMMVEKRLAELEADNKRLAAELKEMYEKHEPVCWEEPGEISPALIMQNSAHKWKF